MFLICCDKFKGSLTSMQVGKALREGIKEQWPQAEIKIAPLADGGDGFSEVMSHYLSLEKKTTQTVDALFRSIPAYWHWQASTRTAYLEVSAANALVQLEKEKQNPELSSSYGTGLLIKTAIEAGAEHIVLGLGGSATNDAGMGILTALGFTLLNKAGLKVNPIGKNLSQITRILPPPVLPDIQFTIAADVENPFYGPNGAAHIFAPQKGADAGMVKRLDAGMENIAAVLSAAYGKDIQKIPSLGAAGGIAAGLLPYFPLKIETGINIVLEAANLSELIQKANCVITGEGKLDAQSLQGKLVGRVAQLAESFQKKCIVVCGINELKKEEAAKLRVKHVLALVDRAGSVTESQKNAAQLLKEMAASEDFKKIIES